MIGSDLESSLCELGSRGGFAARSYVWFIFQNTPRFWNHERVRLIGTSLPRT